MSPHVLLAPLRRLSCGPLGLPRSWDPGLLRTYLAAKTLVAVLVMIGLFWRADLQTRLFAAIGAGFVMQCTATGTDRRRKFWTMLAAGLAMTALAGLGSSLDSHWLCQHLLLVGVAWLAFYVRRFLPNRDLFPVFGFTVCLLSVALPSGWRFAWREMLALAAATPVALGMYFLVLPARPARAVEDELRHFLVRTAEGLELLAGVAAETTADGARRHILSRHVRAMQASPEFIEQTFRNYPGDAGSRRLRFAPPVQYAVLESLLVLEGLLVRPGTEFPHRLRERLTAIARELQDAACGCDDPVVPEAAAPAAALPVAMPEAGRIGFADEVSHVEAHVESPRLFTAAVATERLAGAGRRLARALSGTGAEGPP